MGNCSITTNFNNPLAEELFQSLKEEGVICEDMDVGYGVTVYNGTECENAGEVMTCVQGANDGHVNSEEVLEYALNNYERYQGLIEGVLGRPLPWVLDDLDPETTFDAEIREKIENAINELRNILNEQGLTEGSAEYQEAMAVGLFYLAHTPPLEVLAGLHLNGYAISDLWDVGLQRFVAYLGENGGFDLRGETADVEYSALDAIRNHTGNCTEDSYILFAIMKMAGLSPQFVGLNVLGGDWPNHVEIRVDFDGRGRLFDTTNHESNGHYDQIYPYTLRQVLSDYYDGYGSELGNNGDWEGARSAFETAINIDPQSFGAHGRLGQVLAEQGDLSGARRALERAISIEPESADSHGTLGTVLARSDDLDGSRRELERAISINPDNAYFHVCLGITLKRQGDFEGARAAYERAISIDPGFAHAYYNLGIVLEEQNDLEGARQEFERAITLNPESSKAHYHLGIVLRNQNDLDGARRELETSISIDPDSEKAHDFLGLILLSQNDLDGAREEFERAISIDTNYAGAYINLGLVLQIMGDLEGAKAAYERATSINPNDVLAGYYLAVVSEWLADSEGQR